MALGLTHDDLPNSILAGRRNIHYVVALAVAKTKPLDGALFYLCKL